MIFEILNSFDNKSETDFKKYFKISNLDAKSFLKHNYSIMKVCHCEKKLSRVHNSCNFLQNQLFLRYLTVSDIQNVFNHKTQTIYSKCRTQIQNIAPITSIQ